MYPCACLRAQIFHMPLLTGYNSSRQQQFQEVFATGQFLARRAVTARLSGQAVDAAYLG